jgi:uncharacterized protein (TIGR02246 family)
MKPNIRLTAGIAFAMLVHSGLRAAEPSSEITGLEKAAADFVIAYNHKDAAAVAALFTEQGEITDLSGKESTAGRVAIKARYEELFADKEAPSVAIEVASVRLVGTKLAIEDGTLHFTSPGEDQVARSTTYTAVLQQNDSGVWQIASTRSLKDVSEASGQLADLANMLKGDWTSQKDDIRFDLAFGWDKSGKYLTGEMLTTKPDAKPLTSTFRFGWDAVRKTITCWIFDDGGGFAKADWTQTDDGWKIRTEGTTSDGEATSANQSFVRENNDTFIWTGKDRLIDGESQPDNQLRMVRQAPEPAAE